MTTRAAHIDRREEREEELARLLPREQALLADVDVLRGRALCHSRLARRLFRLLDDAVRLGIALPLARAKALLDEARKEFGDKGGNGDESHCQSS